MGCRQRCRLGCCWGGGVTGKGRAKEPLLGCEVGGGNSCIMDQTKGVWGCLRWRGAGVGPRGSILGRGAVQGGGRNGAQGSDFLAGSRGGGPRGGAGHPKKGVLGLQKKGAPTRDARGRHRGFCTAGGCWGAGGAEKVEGRCGSPPERSGGPARPRLTA